MVTWTTFRIKAKSRIIGVQNLDIAWDVRRLYGTKHLTLGVGLGRLARRHLLSLPTLSFAPVSRATITG